MRYMDLTPFSKKVARKEIISKTSYFKEVKKESEKKLNDLLNSDELLKNKLCPYFNFTSEITFSLGSTLVDFKRGKLEIILSVHNGDINIKYSNLHKIERNKKAVLILENEFIGYIRDSLLEIDNNRRIMFSYAPEQLKKYKFNSLGKIK